VSSKTRVIPVLLHRGRNLVKGVGFNSWRNVGLALQAAKIHQAREVDELIVLDIEAKAPDIEFTKALTEDCFMPLTIGGGVRHVNHVRDLLANGADKISFGAAAANDPKLISECAKKFGSQAIVAAIDVDDQRNVCIANGQKSIHRDAVGYAIDMEQLGVGEILLTSIPRDGTMSGYDLNLIERITSLVNVPVIAAGGAGTYQHMADALKAGAHAVAAGAMFQFTDATPREAAMWLADAGFNMRIAA
jgi:imidazole glycerol-phosphate synthase subunit HisF